MRATLVRHPVPVNAAAGSPRVSPPRYTARMGRMKPRPHMDVPDRGAEEETAYFEERASMREFLGGQDRQAAEWGAAEDTQRWKTREAQAELDAEPSWRERTRR